MQETDILILRLLRDKPSISLTELRDAIRCRSVATVYNRLRALEILGLVKPPPTKKQARSREITEKGKALLKEVNG